MRYIFSILIATSFFFTSCVTQKENTLTIAAASNMVFVLHDLISAFKDATGIHCNLVTASSGKLTTQISLGAPYDVFISANSLYSSYLNSNKDNYSKAETIAIGKLILVSDKKISQPISRFITAAAIKKIAIPNPKVAPYGMATEELFHNWGVYNHISHKLVYGESVGQTNQFILSRSVDAGFTSKSIVFANKMKFDALNYVEIPDSLYTPLAHQLLIVSDSEVRKKAAVQFANFMTTTQAKQILLKNGYDIPE